MTKSIRIGVADDEPDMLEFYQIVIPELGHQLLWAVRSGVELLTKFKQRQPELLIVDIKMPFLNGLDAVRSVNGDHAVPVIVVSGHHDRQTMAQAEEEQILSYLVKPIREADLKTAIAVTMGRFEQLRKLREEHQQNTIFRAGRRLMELTQLSEQQATHRLQAMATKEKRTLFEISETIVNATGGVANETTVDI